MPDDLLRGVEMAKRTCSIDGCQRPHYGCGFCKAHYTRWKSTGDAGLQPMTRSDHTTLHESEGKC